MYLVVSREHVVSEPEVPIKIDQKLTCQCEMQEFVDWVNPVDTAEVGIRLKAKQGDRDFSDPTLHWIDLTSKAPVLKDFEDQPGQVKICGDTCDPSGQWLDSDTAFKLFKVEDERLSEPPNGATPIATDLNWISIDDQQRLIIDPIATSLIGNGNYFVQASY